MTDISNEPSMDDILASIKKIIAEDTGRKLSPSLARRPPSASVASEEEVPRAPIADPIHTDEVFELKAETIDPEPAPAPVQAQVVEPDIVSDAVANASRSALSSLSGLVVKPEVQGSDTLEGLVRDMLRPMLKEWLDANLPDVVEGMVAKEIARISGKTLI